MDFFEDGAYKCRISIPKNGGESVKQKKIGVELTTEMLHNARRGQRYGDPSRRATRARKSASEPVLVTSIPLSINPSMRARMISARLTTLPLRPRMSVDKRSRWTICRSNNTTDTFDQDSW